MLNVIFLLLHTCICIYFISNRNAAILGYLIFFQEIHLVPFNNLGLNTLGFAYYFVMVVVFAYCYTRFYISRERLLFIINNKVIWSILILSLIILLHVILIGLKSDTAYVLVFRFFLQVIPIIIFLIIVLEKKKFLDELAEGIIIYGALLFCVLAFTTDMLSTLLSRGEFREVVGVSPIGLSRRAGIIFITSLFYLLYRDKYKKTVVVVLFISLLVMIASTTRGPFIALFITLFVVLLLKKEKLKTKALRLSVITGIPIIFGVIVLNYIDFEVLFMFLDRLERLQNFENMRRFRRLQWAMDFVQSDFKLTSLYFWLGLGPAGFSYYFGLGYAHNFIIEIILEYGFLGILSVILFLTYSFYYAYWIITNGSSNQYIYIPALFIFLFLSAMVSGDIVGNRNLFFISVIQAISIFFLKNKTNISLRIKMRALLRKNNIKLHVG